VNPNESTNDKAIVQGLAAALRTACQQMQIDSTTVSARAPINPQQAARPLYEGPAWYRAQVLEDPDDYVVAEE
jgi:hypothetical protein